MKTNKSPLRKDGSFDTTENYDDDNDDYLIANEEVEQILGSTRPKNFGEGVTSGIGYMLRGAIGAVGAVVVSVEKMPMTTFCVVSQTIFQLFF